jgi:hypothetical protein
MKAQKRARQCLTTHSCLATANILRRQNLMVCGIHMPELHFDRVLHVV